MHPSVGGGVLRWPRWLGLGPHKLWTAAEWKSGNRRLLRRSGMHAGGRRRCLEGGTADGERRQHAKTEITQARFYGPTEQSVNSFAKPRHLLIGLDMPEPCSPFRAVPSTVLASDGRLPVARRRRSSPPTTLGFKASGGTAAAGGGRGDVDLSPEAEGIVMHPSVGGGVVRWPRWLGLGPHKLWRPQSGRAAADGFGDVRGCTPEVAGGVWRAALPRGAAATRGNRDHPGSVWVTAVGRSLLGRRRQRTGTAGAGGIGIRG
uniref:Uncharacterized protein n=1 Tax=Ananas comosus var. bracteatus TaxID=296719 RepID=A0A6V7Q9S4_ANACO|nr:unnamed protein product [Ananas comosus var. bracteatus]